MMYLAPRQGLFAIIILISFCLQTLFLVFSTDLQLAISHTQKGEQIVANLISEARLALENKDSVSLSVIANRYASEQEVARLVIKDSNGEVLVPVGNAPMQQGNTIEQIAMSGDAIIGSVALTLKEVSKGEIIAMQWPFVIASLFLHILIWVAYYFIARPTKAQINALSHEIDDLHRDKYGKLNNDLLQRTRRVAQVTDATEFDSQVLAGEETLTSSEPEAATEGTSVKNSTINTNVIHSDLNAYLKSQQSVNSADAQIKQTSYPAHLLQADADKKDIYVPNMSRSKLAANRPCDRVSVQIRFFDEYKMLERLTPEMRKPYLALCSQLLNHAIIELLKQPSLSAVSLVDKPYFSNNSAVAVLKADDSQAKAALAGVMLAKLYLMLNKIIHEKHIELSRFALPVMAGVSDSAQSEAMTQLLKTVGKKEQMLILLPTAGLKQINNVIQLHHFKRPTTVYERECTVFDGGSDAIIQQLAAVRNAVLLTGNEDD